MEAAREDQGYSSHVSAMMGGLAGRFQSLQKEIQ